jgi:hypothetical protein
VTRRFLLRRATALLLAAPALAGAAGIRNE